MTCSETTFPARLFPGKISGNSAGESRKVAPPAGGGGELQLSARAPDAALSHRATVAASAAILGIAHESGAVYASAHAPFGTGRAAAKASRACLGKGTLVAATSAVLAVIHKRDRVHAPALAPGLAGRAASRPNSRSLGRRRIAGNSAGIATQQQNRGQAGYACSFGCHSVTPPGEKVPATSCSAAGSLAGCRSPLPPACL